MSGVTGGTRSVASVVEVDWGHDGSWPSTGKGTFFDAKRPGKRGIPQPVNGYEKRAWARHVNGYPGAFSSLSRVGFRSERMDGAGTSIAGRNLSEAM